MGLLARRCLIAAPTRTGGPCPVRNVRRVFSFLSPSIRNMAPRTAGQKPGKLYTPLASTPEVSAAASARTSTYGTRGYNFIEGLSTLSPTAVLGRLKVVVSLYVVVSASVFGAVVWFLTTRSYVLTLDPDPKSDARYKTFSCDYAVIRNRWTGKRHTVDMVPVSAGNAGANVRHHSPMSATAESVEGISTMEKRIKVNWLIYSVQLYLHVTNSVVVLDLKSQLDPYRFTKSIYRAQFHSRSPVEAGTDAKAGSDVNSGGSEKGNRLVIHSRVRPALVRNYSQKGTLPQYERMVESVAGNLLGDLYRQAILSRVGTSISPSVAAELLRNGQLNGNGLTCADIIGDRVSFADEVRKRVEEEMKEKAIILQCDAMILH